MQRQKLLDSGPKKKVKGYWVPACSDGAAEQRWIDESAAIIAIGMARDQDFHVIIIDLHIFSWFCSIK